MRFRTFYVSVFGFALAACARDDLTGITNSDGSGIDSGDGSADDGASGAVPPDCLAGDIQCSEDGGAIQECSGDGFWEDMPCGANEICVDGQSGPSCASTLQCTPGEIVCTGESTYTVCDSSGQWGATQACGLGETCNPELTGAADVCVESPWDRDYALYIDEAGGVSCSADFGSDSDIRVDVMVYRANDASPEWIREGSFPIDYCPLTWTEPVIISGIDESTAIVLDFYDEDLNFDDYLGSACRGDGVEACYYLTEEDLNGTSKYWELSAWAYVRMVAL